MPNLQALVIPAPKDGKYDPAAERQSAPQISNYCTEKLRQAFRDEADFAIRRTIIIAPGQPFLQSTTDDQKVRVVGLFNATEGRVIIAFSEIFKALGEGKKLCFLSPATTQPNLDLVTQIKTIQMTAYENYAGKLADFCEWINTKFNGDTDKASRFLTSYPRTRDDQETMAHIEENFSPSLLNAFKEGAKTAIATKDRFQNILTTFQKVPGPELEIGARKQEIDSAEIAYQAIKKSLSQKDIAIVEAASESAKNNFKRFVLQYISSKTQLFLKETLPHAQIDKFKLADLQSYLANNNLKIANGEIESVCATAISAGVTDNDQKLTALRKSASEASACIEYAQTRLSLLIQDKLKQQTILLEKLKQDGADETKIIEGIKSISAEIYALKPLKKEIVDAINRCKLNEQEIPLIKINKVAAAALRSTDLNTLTLSQMQELIDTHITTLEETNVRPSITRTEVAHQKESLNIYKNWMDASINDLLKNKALSAELKVKITNLNSQLQDQNFTFNSLNACELELTHLIQNEAGAQFTSLAASRDKILKAAKALAGTDLATKSIRLSEKFNRIATKNPIESANEIEPIDKEIKDLSEAMLRALKTTAIALLQSESIEVTPFQAIIQQKIEAINILNPANKIDLSATIAAAVFFNQHTIDLTQPDFTDIKNTINQHAQHYTTGLMQLGLTEQTAKTIVDPLQKSLLDSIVQEVELRTKREADAIRQAELAQERERIEAQFISDQDNVLSEEEGARGQYDATELSELAVLQRMISQEAKRIHENARAILTQHTEQLALRINALRTQIILAPTEINLTASIGALNTVRNDVSMLLPIENAIKTLGTNSKEVEAYRDAELLADSAIESALQKIQHEKDVDTAINTLQTNITLITESTKNNPIWYQPPLSEKHKALQSQLPQLIQDRTLDAIKAAVVSAASLLDEVEKQVQIDISIITLQTELDTISQIIPKEINNWYLNTPFNNRFDDLTLLLQQEERKEITDAQIEQARQLKSDMEIAAQDALEKLQQDITTSLGQKYSDISAVLMRYGSDSLTQDERTNSPVLTELREINALPDADLELAQEKLQKITEFDITTIPADIIKERIVVMQKSIQALLKTHQVELLNQNAVAVLQQNGGLVDPSLAKANAVIQDPANAQDDDTLKNQLAALDTIVKNQDHFVTDLQKAHIRALQKEIQNYFPLELGGALLESEIKDLPADENKFRAASLTNDVEKVASMNKLPRQLALLREIQSKSDEFKIYVLQQRVLAAQKEIQSKLMIPENGGRFSATELSILPNNQTLKAHCQSLTENPQTTALDLEAQLKNLIAILGQKEVFILAILDVRISAEQSKKIADINILLTKHAIENIKLADEKTLLKSQLTTPAANTLDAQQTQLRELKALKPEALALEFMQGRVVKASTDMEPANSISGCQKQLDHIQTEKLIRDINAAREALLPGITQLSQKEMAGYKPQDGNEAALAKLLLNNPRKGFIESHEKANKRLLSELTQLNDSQKMSNAVTNLNEFLKEKLYERDLTFFEKVSNSVSGKIGLAVTQKHLDQAIRLVFGGDYILGKGGFSALQKETGYVSVDKPAVLLQNYNNPSYPADEQKIILITKILMLREHLQAEHLKHSFDDNKDSEAHHIWMTKNFSEKMSTSELEYLLSNLMRYNRLINPVSYEHYDSLVNVFSKDDQAKLAAILSSSKYEDKDEFTVKPASEKHVTYDEKRNLFTAHYIASWQEKNAVGVDEPKSTAVELRREVTEDNKERKTTWRVTSKTEIPWEMEAQMVARDSLKLRIAEKQMLKEKIAHLEKNAAAMPQGSAQAVALRTQIAALKETDHKFIPEAIAITISNDPGTKQSFQLSSGQTILATENVRVAIEAHFAAGYTRVEFGGVAYVPQPTQQPAVLPSVINRHVRVMDNKPFVEVTFDSGKEEPSFAEHIKVNVKALAAQGGYSNPPVVVVPMVIDEVKFRELAAKFDEAAMLREIGEMARKEYKLQLPQEVVIVPLVAIRGSNGELTSSGLETPAKKAIQDYIDAGQRVLCSHDMSDTDHKTIMNGYENNCLVPVRQYVPQQLADNQI